MLFNKTLLLLAATMGLANASATTGATKVTICVRQDPESEFLIDYITPPEDGGLPPSETEAGLEEQGFEVALPGEVRVVGGVSVTLDGDCSHSPGVMVTLCVRLKGYDGNCETQNIEKDYASLEAFKAVLEERNYDFFTPGTRVPYKGGYGIVQDNCSCIKPPGPTSYGDPHFNTWSGEQFDFHGGCDLVLLENQEFANGLGLNIHIRTKINTWWSLIESAVVQIGENTLQITGGDKEATYSLNGEVHDLQTAEGSLGDYPVKFHRINDHQGRIRIDLGDNDAIMMETYKDFVRVNLGAKTHDKWVGSGGLLGSYPEGKMLSRDGKTLIEDPNAFGQEWMVLPSEGKLFHDAGNAFETCEMPTKSEGRRLGESMISEEDAATACARVPTEFFDACIFDVLATNDKDMAGSY